MAIITLPVYCLVVLHDRIGRKGLSVITLFLSSVFSIAVGIVLHVSGTSQPILLLVLKLITYLMTLTGLNSTVIHSTEVLPTVVRGQSVLVLMMLAFLATIFSPQLVYLNKYWKPLTDIFIGVLIMIASIISLFLPETYKKTLPVTLEDGEMFGKDEKIFEFTFYSKNKLLKTNC